MRILIKHIKKANCWCRSIFENGKQTQEWFDHEPTKDEIYERTNQKHRTNY